MASEGDYQGGKRRRGWWVFASVLLLSCALGELVQFGVIHLSTGTIAVLRSLFMVLVFAGATFALIWLVRTWRRMEALTPSRWTKWILFVGALGMLSIFFGLPVFYLLGRADDATMMPFAIAMVVGMVLIGFGFLAIMVEAGIKGPIEPPD